MTEGTVCPAPHPVIPAQAGTHLCRPRCPMAWAPACAGVTGVSLPYRPGESRDLDHGQCPVGPGSGILPGRLGGVNPCAHNARESLPCTPPCHPRASGDPSLPPEPPYGMGPRLRGGDRVYLPNGPALPIWRHPAISCPKEIPHANRRPLYRHHRCLFDP